MTHDIHTCSYQCDRPACIRAQRDELARTLQSVESLAGAAEVSGEVVGILHVEHFRECPSMRNTDFVECVEFKPGRHEFVLATDYAALQAKLDAVAKDADRWLFVRDNWHRLATATMLNGDGHVECSEVFIMPAHEAEPPMVGVTEAIDAAMSALSDQGRAAQAEIGEGRSDG